MRELRPGVWHWEAPHPDWQATEPWSENVSSYAIDEGERLLLFDSLAVPSELVNLAAYRETAIVLTAPWHERDAQSLVERSSRAPPTRDCCSSPWSRWRAETRTSPTGASGP